MTAKPEVVLYPAFNALYYSFYIEGLRRLIGASRIRLSTNGFPDLGSHGLALRVLGETEQRIFISASDGPGLNKVALGWSDVFAKVNLDLKGPPPGVTQKVIAPGLYFPVRVWAPIAAGLAASRSFFAGRGRIPSAREHFANYRRQYRYRLPETAYRPGKSEGDYVFSLSTLWRNEPETNRLRSLFIQAASGTPGLRFEGGFAPRRGTPVPGFEAETASQRTSIAEYVRKTQRSCAVFNTPAVSGCHGWKLGEFLALGKAIISTRLSRELPAPLEHGRHLHLVDGSRESMTQALLLLSKDSDYRHHLEQGARRYYSKYLSPENVLQRIFEQVGDASAIVRSDTEN